MKDGPYSYCSSRPTIIINFNFMNNVIQIHNAGAAAAAEAAERLDRCPLVTLTGFKLQVSLNS